MRKVYIAAAFRKHSERTNIDRVYGELIDPVYIKLLEAVEDLFLDFDFSTCLPHRDEGMWGKVYYEPGAISALCFRHVHTSDVIFALAEEGRGVHVELGYAAGLGNKRIILAYREGHEPSTLIHGLSEDASRWAGIPKGLCGTTIFCYHDKEDLLAKLRGIVQGEFGSHAQQATARTRTNIGIIDIGSHTVKLKVLSCRSGSHPNVVHSSKQSLGIMGDVLQKGELSKDSIEGIIGLLRSWQLEGAKLNCQLFVVTGTAALRKARNASELNTAISREFGWELRVLTPERELEYVFAGVKAAFKPDSTVAVLNLGGGSTQLGIGDGPLPSECHYFDFGTRRLIESWPWQKPMSKQVYAELLAFVKREISKGLVNRSGLKPEKMVHTGGELDFMLRCRLPLSVSKLSPGHVSEISLPHFARFSEEFSQLSPEIVAKEFGLDPAWAAGSVASNVIALSMAEAIGVASLVPSNLNISDGLVYEALEMARVRC